MKRVVSASHQIGAKLDQGPFGKYLLNRLKANQLSVTQLLTGFFSLSVSLIEALIVILITSIYIAAQPGIYRNGIVALFPPRMHPLISDTIDAIAAALRLWLLGQLIEMVIIGLLSTIAVWLIGLPSPIALGLIATVTEFVPYIGPIMAAVPALLVAVTQGPADVLWTLAAYLLIHQVEGDVVQPLIQRKMIYVPPAAMLLGIAAIGSLFGILGVVFAAPIVGAIFVAVQKLYVREALNEPTTLPGETASHDR